MAAVLGIDAAWTEHEPSGLALLERDADGWRSVALAPSYEAFVNLASGTPVSWAARPRGGTPDLGALLASAEKLLGGRRVTVIAVDMPLALTPITGRRTADNAISAVFGGRGCGTHSPSAGRPGLISAQLRGECAAHGYHLATASVPVGSEDCLIEVYPHPALLSLMNAGYRVPYKVSKARKYWPGTSSADRAAGILAAFSAILAALQKHVRGVTLELPGPTATPSVGLLKRYEDALDALVCAWVGTRYLAGQTKAYGDGGAAIWVPKNGQEVPPCQNAGDP